MLVLRKIMAAERKEMGMGNLTAAGARGAVEAAVGAGGTVEATTRLVEELTGRGWDDEVYVKNRLVMLLEVCVAVGMLLAKL